MEKPKSIGAVLVSVILLLVGGATGATVEHLFGVQEQIELEKRNQKLKAYTDWITYNEALGSVGMSELQTKELQARARIIVFGGKAVLESMAAFNRAKAARKHKPDKIAEFLKKESANAKSFAKIHGKFLLSLRREYQETDDVSWQTLVTIDCPNPGICRGEHLASQLFDPTF